MGLFFFFEDTRMNVFLYLTALSAVLYLSPEYIFPKWSLSYGVPLVEAPCGNIMGTKLESRSGRQIFSYQGIPFAQPPVGELRFSRPKPLETPFEDTFQAIKSSEHCVSPIGILGYKTTVGSEDCLKLNVYVPEVESDKKLPVLFWIHGGGFLSGDASEFIYGPKFLLDRDVILVSTGYRLGPLGYLNLGREGITGNQGIWDQRLALQWVQTNIHAFGGDPEKVTIFGESAGSMSVMYHMSSSGSEGLFSGAIAQSGSIPYDNFLNFDKTRSIYTYHNMYAEELGCPATAQPEDQANCLRDLDLKAVYSKHEMFESCSFLEPIMGSKMTFPAAWKPSFDGPLSREPFFALDPEEVIARGETLKVPLMIGFNRDEGLLTVGAMLKNQEQFDKLKNNWDECIVVNAFGKAAEDITPNDLSLSKDLTDFYFPTKDNPTFNLETSIQNLTKYFTDGTFSFSTDFTARSIARNKDSKVFYYYFTHLGQTSFGDVFELSSLGFVWNIILQALGFNPSPRRGVAHANDIPYLFNQGLPVDMLRDPSDLDMSHKMVDLWVNFATHQHPTPVSKDGKVVGTHLQDIQSHWKTVSQQLESKKPIYYTIESSNGFQHVEDDDLSQRLDFWQSKVAKKLKW